MLNDNDGYGDNHDDADKYDNNDNNHDEIMMMMMVVVVRMIIFLRARHMLAIYLCIAS